MRIWKPSSGPAIVKKIGIVYSYIFFMRRRLICLYLTLIIKVIKEQILQGWLKLNVIRKKIHNLRNIETEHYILLRTYWTQNISINAVILSVCLSACLSLSLSLSFLLSLMHYVCTISEYQWWYIWKFISLFQPGSNCNLNREFTEWKISFVVRWQTLLYNNFHHDVYINYL